MTVISSNKSTALLMAVANKNMALLTLVVYKYRHHHSFVDYYYSAQVREIKNYTSDILKSIIMADKQNADVPQTEEPTASPQATDQEAGQSPASQSANETATSQTANQAGSATTASDGAAASANAPSDGGAAAASNVSTTEHHPILHDFVTVTAQLAKNMRTISQYIIKCHNAFITVQALDTCIASSSSTHNSIRLINTMLDIHKSIANEVAEDSTADYLEFIKEKIFRYYNLEHIYTARSRYNLRHSRCRVYNNSSRDRRRQRQQRY